MYKIFMRTVGFSFIMISVLSVSFSAATLPSVDHGNYYGKSHSLFLENFPADNYSFSDNTSAVKNILKNDTELGYLNYPVNLNHNILTNSDDNIYIYTGSQSYDVNSSEFKAMIDNLSESSKANINRFITDVDNELGTLESSVGLGGFNSYTYGSNSSDDILTMGDVGNRVRSLFSN